jgi:hypothetical protein
LGYHVEVLASNDHEQLGKNIQSWLDYEEPEKIFFAEFVADGAEFTYAVMFVYLKKKQDVDG